MSPHIPKIAGLFALPIITKDLTAVDFGVFGLITAYVSALSIFSNLGMRVVMVNSFYKIEGHYKWLWRQLYGFLYLWGFIYSFLVFALIMLIIPDEASGNSLIIALTFIIPIVLFGPSQILFNTYHQLRSEPLQIGLRTTTFGILAIFLNILFISGLKLGYMGWFYSHLAVSFVSNLSYIIPLRKNGITPIFNFKWRLIKNGLKTSLPTVPHFYSGFLLDSSDRIAMDFVNVSISQIGVFDIGAKFGGYFRALGNALSRAVGPMMIRSYKDQKEYIARDLVFIMMIGFLILTFTISLWLKEIFIILIKNDELQKAYPIGIIVIMANNYRPMYLGSINKIFYLEKTALLWRISFIAGAGNLLLNLILVPIYGIQAAAITTFVALFYMGYSGFLIKRIRETLEEKYYPWLWASITIILTVISYYGVELDYQYKLLLSIVILIFGVVMISSLNRKMSSKND